ncbi:cytochrome P450 [Nocardioides KLBMP 9356]|uniref:Cytochrome P450 n=1 Tax=Nocardioides potassii TaxID=2911371 RepID=A0ABS9H6W6_9ACTN|nr:cytochrome P450 [Nocardioides potassii]MCF6376194.1 cytochrome P450 [Nocardioides potassii]
MHLDSVESAGGRLGAVLSAPRSGAVALGPHGPWLVTTPALARRVLTEPDRFDFPGDVSRSGDLSASRGETRSGHVVLPPLTPAEVARGREVLETEWHSAIAEHDRTAPGTPYDATVLLRRPVARSTVAAVLVTDVPTRDRVADLTLAWIDALAPVISARRPPGRWSRARRAERDARFALDDALRAVPDLATPPEQVATMLAAGVQVPIAAGAWLLAWLAAHPADTAEDPDRDPLHAVWETLRLTPPTWVTARITTEPVDLAGTEVPAGRVVLVSPLLLGRLPELVPGDPDALAGFDPSRWTDGSHRPGAWLPFGAGPHACPGRTLGLAQLVHLATWAGRHRLGLAGHVGIDQSRGIAPLPCLLTIDDAVDDAGRGGSL